MAAKSLSNFKLGIFVLTGLSFLILALYLIGKNKNLFGSTYVIKTHFQNVQGLTSGNNVRYAGIQVGTVKKITILSNGQIEVELLIDNKMKQYIRKNASVTIATDGLMGNKVVNIVPGSDDAELVLPGDTMMTESIPGLDNMISTFSGTNNDLSIVVAELKKFMLSINSSTALWTLLNDSTLSQNLSASLSNIKMATIRANTMVNDLDGLVRGVKEGKGALGAVLTDSSITDNLNEALVQIKHVASQADTLAKELSQLTTGLKSDMDHGKGTVNALLKDTAMAKSIHVSLDNIQKSTHNFNAVMEGLKHSFLVRGYFKKQEKRQAKEAQKNQKVQ